MKISVNWVKEYTDIDLTIDELVEKIGAQLGEVENVEHLGRKYEGVVVARVVECKPHPNADRLSLCKIDDGGVVKNVDRVHVSQAASADAVSSSERVAQGDVQKGTLSEQRSEKSENALQAGGVDSSAGKQSGRSRGLVQVVCGAPNVREGMLVAWLPPGVTVPKTYDKDPFVLEAREVRGETSNGMLASANELAISDDHAGILEIDKEAKPGDSFSKLYGMDDYIIEIENKMFTHRPDCFGLLGVAREIAGIQQKKFTSPKWYLQLKSNEQRATSNDLPLSVENEIPDLVPRFMAVSIKGVQVGPSPVDVQVKLQKAGIKPVNNIVDITNYMMYLTGQPMHAYDYDKVIALSAPSNEQRAKSKGTSAKIVIRHAKQGEKLKVLGGKVIEPKPQDIMIATDKELIGFGGVIGGADTEVDANTTNIILECANFDLYAVRKTSMEHGLFTDAVTRFSKGQSPLQCDRVLNKAINMISDLGGSQSGSIVDKKKASKENKDPELHEVKFINKRLGLDLELAEVKRLLSNVEFEFPGISGKRLVVKPPFWRTDIRILEDVVEEVGRLYGYDNLPLQLPTKTMSPSAIDNDIRIKSFVRNKLSSLGANEVMNYSFVHGSLLEKTNQDSELAYQIKNALSPDLQYYRLSLTPSLLEKIHPNIKAGFDQFALFEVGKVHGQSEVEEDGLPKELGRVGFVVAGNKKSKVKSDYFLAKYYLGQLYPENVEITYHKPGDTVLDKHKMASQMLSPFEPKRSAVVFVGGKPVGVVGEYKLSVIQKLKLPEQTAGFELFLSTVTPQSQASYQPISKFPYVEQDISLKTDAGVDFGQIKMALEETLEKYSPQDVVTEADCIDIFQKEESHKQTTFRIKAVSSERTLSSKVVSLMLDKVAEDLSKSIKAQRL